MNPPSRAFQMLRATAVVALLGAIGGALGGAFIAVSLVLAGGIHGADGALQAAQDLAGAATFVGAFGAVYGVVLGPLLGWTLMRRVPIGRAIAETAFAAAIGVGAAMFLPSWGFSILVYPVLAALAAAARLRYSYRLAPERTTPPDQIGPG